MKGVLDFKQRIWRNNFYPWHQRKLKLSSSSNYIVDVVTWSNFGWFNVLMREVIINPNSYRFHQKNRFFWEAILVLSKFNNFRLVLGMSLKIYSFVRKELKLKVLQETSKERFCTPPITPAPAILNKAKGKLTDSRSVKTIKIEK